MAVLTLPQSRSYTRRQTTLSRVACRPTVVLACKDARAHPIRDCKQAMNKKLEKTALQSITAGGRPVMVASVEQSMVTELLDVDSTTFYPTLEAAGDKLVVVDFYAAWCGPCKLIYPALCEMAAEYALAGVQFVKFECKKQSKELGIQLGIRVAPTCHLYKSGVKVAEMTGVKVDLLRELIEMHK